MLPLDLQCRSLLIWCEWEKSGLLMYFFLCVVPFVFTAYIKLGECCVWFQCITHWCRSPFSNHVDYWWYESEKSGLLIDVICYGLFVYVCSHLKLSFVSVVFVFNASLNDFAPSSLIGLTINWVKRKKSGLCHLFVISFMFTIHIKHCKCCVCLQCITQWFCSSFSN